LKLKFQTVAEKTAKTLGGYFILPYLVHIWYKLCYFSLHKFAFTTAEFYFRIAYLHRTVH